jgi:hypothetical protein
MDKDGCGDYDRDPIELHCERRDVFQISSATCDNYNPLPRPTTHITMARFMALCS